MKFGRLEAVLFVLFNLLVSSPAAAQWQTPNHSVPIGRGAGVIGFGSVAPGITDLPMLSSGASADPSFRALPNSGLAQTPANTIKCNPTGSLAAVQDCTVAQVSAMLPSPSINTVTANYTIATTDCGKTVRAGTGSTGNFALALPSTVGFPATCTIIVTNGDTARGKKLSSGFPADIAATWSNLGPLQSLGVQIINSAWASFYNPGRWQTSGETFFVDPVAGSDANDGLAAGAGSAFLTLGHAINVLYASVSHNYGPVPTINVCGGCSITESVVITGQPVGVDGVTIQGNGSAFAWNNSSSFCVEVGDMAIAEFFNITFTCGSGVDANFGIFVHNHAVVDVFTGVTFGNMGSNGDDIHCDFQGQTNLNSSYTITGTKARHINMLSHCVVSDGSITITASGTPTIGTFIKAFGGSYMNGFSATYAGAYTAGMKQWDVQGNSVLLNDGTTVPGSVAGTTANGGVVCANC